MDEGCAWGGGGGVRVMVRVRVRVESGLGREVGFGSEPGRRVRVTVRVVVRAL